jgi:hypothetical protein
LLLQERRTLQPRQLHLLKRRQRLSPKPKNASMVLELYPTEASIIVARKIKFIPATLDGRLVSVFIQLEYNFNLY